MPGEGYCYLHLFRSTNRANIKQRLGSFPTVAAVKTVSSQLSLKTSDVYVRKLGISVPYYHIDVQERDGYEKISPYKFLAVAENNLHVGGKNAKGVVVCDTTSPDLISNDVCSSNEVYDSNEVSMPSNVMGMSSGNHQLWFTPVRWLYPLLVAMTITFIGKACLILNGLLVLHKSYPSVYLSAEHIRDGAFVCVTGNRLYNWDGTCKGFYPRDVPLDYSIYVISCSLVKPSVKAPCSL